MTIPLLNPYDGIRGVWLRGNFHGHSAPASGCASVTLRGALRRYRAMGADFTALTNHDRVVSLERARTRYPRMLLFEGFEHSRAENLVFVGEEVPPLHELPLGEALMAAERLLTFACHPRTQRGEEHWTRAALQALTRLPDGIEVYNGHYGVPRMLAKGCVPLYADFWDELLSSGMRLWGLSNDDSHDPVDFGNAWNMVCATERTAPAVIAAAKAGRFYATTGLHPSDLRGEGARLVVSFSEPVEGRFIGPGRRILQRARGLTFARSLGQERYMRFEAESDRGRVFLQPIFAEAGDAPS